MNDIPALPAHGAFIVPYWYSLGGRRTKLEFASKVIDELDELLPRGNNPSRTEAIGSNHG